MVWDEGGTYVETDVVFKHNITHEWNHGLGEIVTAVLAAGLRADRARGARHRAVGRAARPDERHRRTASAGSPTGPSGCPHTYTLQARRPL